MTTFRVLGLAACFGAFLVANACGEDEALVRPRLDAGTPDAAASGDGGTLSCGAPRPTEYLSANFETNAAAEIGLGNAFDQLSEKLRTPAEGDGGVAVTAADLKTLYGTGAPSLRSVSTPATQTAVEASFDAFEKAFGKAWSPTDADQDAGAATGGQYGDWFVSPAGADLREAATKALLQGALYNQVLAITASPVNDAGIDRLLALFGATRAFAGRTDADAGLLRDRLIAEYASNRDDKQSTPPGPYRAVRDALLDMKAAASGGDKCASDLAVAVRVFREQWEKTVWASAIFYLNQAVATITTDPSKGPEALHAFGSALGFIQSFSGVPETSRKMNDAQINALLTNVGAASPWKLVTAVGETAPKLTSAIKDIQQFQGLSDTEVESFKKAF